MKKLLLILFLVPLIGFSQNCNTLYLTMIDSSGNGWSGNMFTIVDSTGNTIFSTTLNSGSFGLDSICLPDDCYGISCNGGTNQNEVSWSLSDSNGTVLLLGGAPYSDSICLPYNCTPDPDSFESPNLSWTNGVYNGFGQTTDLPWIRNQGPTSTNNTGPSYAFNGVYYMHLECASFPLGAYATLEAGCVNPLAYTNPYLSFAYHMYGIAIGSLNVDVSVDDGLTWSTVWAKSGNHGDVWNQAHIDLSAYTSNIMIRIVGVVGTTTYGDIAIDLLSIGSPIMGCTDYFADNYDTTAVVDDNSCVYDNCTQLTLDLYDSYGDGWNGNYISFTDAGGDVLFYAWLSEFPNGSSFSLPICLPADCYSIYCGGGFWQNEVSWTLSDSLGNIIRSGGAPYSGGVCFPQVYGCDDILALNYDSSVTISDSSCIYPQILLTASVNDISCNGQSDGYIDLVVSGGIPPLTFLWSNGSTNEDINNLVSGSYSVIVTDNNGNNETALFDISEPDSLIVNFIVIDASGVGINDGEIYSFVSGGTPSYTYYWLSSFVNDTTPNLIGVPAGTYTSYILDANGCFNYVGVNVGIDSTSNGCTDSLAFNYDSSALVDDGSCIYIGCTDPIALNYNINATIDDGSCYYVYCNDTVPTGLSLNWTTDTKAEINWDNMNIGDCMAWKYYVRYRELGAPSWNTKSAGVGNGLCNFGLNTTTKVLQNLSSGTTYEYKMKAFYCGGGESGYSNASQFTTASDCPIMTNLNVQTFNANHSKASFSWDSTGAYVFARIALRVDTAGSSWLTAGGFGVYYPTLTVNKFGLQSAESYRAQGRTFCDPNITSYRSLWTSPIFWTQPALIKMNGGTVITNLDVYPNPSRDIFNISFSSDIQQDLSIRIVNVVGAEVYSEKRQKFIGEYTKQINIDNYGKGIYLLEIETSNGIINKKLIVQ